jgi:hypothetical protein
MNVRARELTETERTAARMVCPPQALAVRPPGARHVVLESSIPTRTLCGLNVDGYWFLMNEPFEVSRIDCLQCAALWNLKTTKQTLETGSFSVLPGKSESRTVHPSGLFSVENVELPSEILENDGALDIVYVLVGNIILSAFSKRWPLCDGTRGEPIQIVVRNYGTQSRSAIVRVIGTLLELADSARFRDALANGDDVRTVSINLATTKLKDGAGR